MARLTAYDDGQIAKRPRVPVAAFRWAWHTGLVPAPDFPSGRWSQAAVEARDADVIRASLPHEPITAARWPRTGSPRRWARRNVPSEPPP
ncbi:hypothetical protein [Streptomyces acidicola]|uniref:Uncharacterized protein n=1 Tax=Streptomyces acidicola TaxID=2596892 RepID=A0A5N8WM75_9ACTN|nr:hypothetical protein [Streptomyces acidicola]MPY47624.1 hypothetical protein [Streptomyces acidicola]